MNREELNTLAPAVALEHALMLLLGAALGALFAAVVVPHWLPGMAASLTGSHPKAYWYLARGAGIVAYVLLWLSIVLGLMVTGKLSRVWPGSFAAVDLHQFTSLLALAFALFHMLILLGDRYIGYSVAQLLIPFASTGYRPLWVGLGQVGLYLTAIVTFSFYVRRRIGHRTWRFVHYGSFMVYFLVTIHGLEAGTDTRSPAMVALYGLTGLTTYALTVYRILVSGSRKATSGQRPARVIQLSPAHRTPARAARPSGSWLSHQHAREQNERRLWCNG